MAGARVIETLGLFSRLLVCVLVFRKQCWLVGSLGESTRSYVLRGLNRVRPPTRNNK